MTDETSPQERAAETKRRRTRARFIEAADVVIKREGWDLTVEQVCQEAGMSPATFYTVFATKGEMFTEVFRELVLHPIPAEADLVERHGYPARSDPTVHFSAVTDFFTELQANAKGRSELVRGTLAARLNNPPPVVSQEKFIFGESGGDVVLEVAYHLFYLVAPIFVNKEGVPTGELLAPVVAVQAVALFVLDSLATANGQNAGMLTMLVAALLVPLDASVAGLFEASLEE